VCCSLEPGTEVESAHFLGVVVHGGANQFGGAKGGATAVLVHVVLGHVVLILRLLLYPLQVLPQLRFEGVEAGHSTIVVVALGAAAR